MAEIGEDNEPLIPSYLSRAKSASAHQLTLFLLVSSASFAHYLSVALSLPFSLSLSRLFCALHRILHLLLCISVRLDVILGHSCLEQTHLPEYVLPIRPTRMTLNHW